MKVNALLGGPAADLEAARIGFHSAFLATLATIDTDPLQQLFAEVRSTTQIEEWKWLGDVPGFTEWKGDRKLGQMDQFKMRLENKDWSNGIRVHHNELADDNTGMLQIGVQGLAREARLHRVDLAVQMLLNGFTGTAFPDVGNGLSYDGALFFSDSHQMPGYSAVQSNKMTLHLDAEGAAIEAATIKLGSMRSYDGKKTLSLGGTTLIVGPSNQFVAERLMAAEYLANGATNIHRNRYKVLVSPRLVDAFASYWFLADLSAPVKPLLFQLREDITTSAVTDEGSFPVFNRREYWFGAQARYNVGPFEPRTIVGSTGAT